MVNFFKIYCALLFIFMLFIGTTSLAKDKQLSEKEELELKIITKLTSALMPTAIIANTNWTIKYLQKFLTRISKP